jgi:HlyD family secretion protein
MNKSTKLAALGYALSAAAIVLALLVSKKPEAEPAREAPPVLAVRVIQPRAQIWGDDIAATGRLVAWEEATIGVELDGLRLIDIRVDVGERVKKGQLLAQYDPAPAQAELNERIALLAEAQALLVEAEENARRGESLRDTGAISRQVITQYVTRAQTARAQVASAQARLESTRLRLKQTRIEAPDDGVISARTATLGSVGVNGAELFRLIRQNRIEWHAEVATDRMGRLAIGQAATMSLPDGSILAGTVRQIAPVLAADLTAIVYVQLIDPEHALARIGMHLQGTIVSGTSPALTIPTSSIVVRDGREYAFAVAVDNRVTQVPLQTGRRRGAEIEVLAGLVAEQAVVTSGAGFLHDGDLVRVAAAASGTQAASR